MSEYESIERRSSPNTRSSLALELRTLGVGSSQTPLIVHASLSRLGWVCGGAVAVCQALFDAVSPQGNLIMAAQSTEHSDPATWTSPPVPEAWWPTIRAEMPLYDPALTPGRAMGAVAEAFRTWPGTVRSPHPCVSFTAHGPRAHAIVSQHPLSLSFGDSSPLGRLYEMDASVLLLGCEYDACTALHLAEARSPMSPRAIKGVATADANGVREWTEYEDVAYDADLFLWLGTDYEKRARADDFSVGRVGLAESRLVSMRPLVDFGVEWLAARKIV